MRDEKEERKKQARANKQTRQTNTAHPRQSLFLEKMSCLGDVYMLINFPLMFLHVCTCIFTLYILQVQLCILFSLQDLQREEPPSKYSRLKPPTQYDHSNPGSGSKAKKKTHTQLPRKVTRNQHDKIGPIADFNLRLVDYVMFGEATLAMFFSLSPTMTDRDKDFGQVLVVRHGTTYKDMYSVLMRDEKERRKKQARSNKQTRQSNTFLLPSSSPPPLHTRICTVF